VCTVFLLTSLVHVGSQRVFYLSTFSFSASGEEQGDEGPKGGVGGAVGANAVGAVGVSAGGAVRASVGGAVRASVEGELGAGRLGLRPKRGLWLYTKSIDVAYSKHTF
jgi:hypothetical protein